MIDPESYPLWNSPAISAFLKTLSIGEMFVEGRGVRLRDVNGTWFLDARSGLWNVTLGYDNPRVREAIKRQVDVLPYANAIGYGRPSALSLDAANALVPHLPAHLNKIRYCSNGSQAVETAVLLSRFLHRVACAPERSTVFGMWRGFHGLGAGGGALTGIPYVHYQSGQLLPDVLHAPGPFESSGGGQSDLELAITAHGPERVAAVVVEPIVGEGGHVLSAEYLHSLARFCRENGIHFIVDEISTGMGRTGAFTRSEQLGLRPDIITLGKGMTSGYAPLAAVVLSDEIYARIREVPYDQQFVIGSTNDGHPLGLAASIAVATALTTDGVLDNVATRGEALGRRLAEVSRAHPHVAAVRGAGLMHAVELASPDGSASGGASATNLLRLAMEGHGVLVSTLAKWPAIMVVPPLVLTDDDVEEIVTALDRALADIAPLYGVTAARRGARGAGS